VSHPEDFVRTFADRFLSYAIGRGTETSDFPAVRKIVRDTAAQDYRWSALVQAVVHSTPFGMSTSAPLVPGAHDREQTP
jgi:hypothetical protein